MSNNNALEFGEPVTFEGGTPNPFFTVAIENMGYLATPEGLCPIACWYETIPAQAPSPQDFDNSHGGSGFMVGSLDFYGAGDRRVSVFYWTGLANLNSPNCSTCSGIQFGGQLFSHTAFYYGEGFLAAQKAGPVPLGDVCGAAGLAGVTSCVEGGIATNGDGATQASQGNGHIYAAISTEIAQSFASESTPEVHQGALYWVFGTDSFDRSGILSFTGQGYVSPAHEDLEFPAIAAAGSSHDGNSQGDGAEAIMTFTLSGNGGPTGADNGGFYPSTAYGRVSSTGGLQGSQIYIADLGQSPQDGFTEYQTSPFYEPRWGDYSWAIYEPTLGRFYFATNYIQYPSCSDAEFTLAKPTCGGTRDGYANWGTSVNYVDSGQDRNQQ